MFLLLIASTLKTIIIIQAVLLLAKQKALVLKPIHLMWLQEPQGLFSFHPVLPHCTRARRAGPIRVVPRASYADGVALGAPENHNPLPRLGPFWKINLCGASEARLFSAKNPKFSGVFRYAFTKSGESIPPFRGYGQEKER